jgi:hypothetical protein
MKSKILALFAFLFQVNASESTECHRHLLSSMNCDSARASLIWEEFDGKGN